MFRRPFAPGIAVTPLAAVLVPAAPAFAANVGVEAVGETFFDPDIGDFVGAAEVTFEDPPEPVLADSMTFLLGPPMELPNGMLIAAKSHTFDFGDLDGDGITGTFTTIDFAILVPTDMPGVYELHAQLRLDSGTGAFEDVRGHVRRTQGTIDMVAGHAQWAMTGRLTT
jgi:hypothetical protein